MGIIRLLLAIAVIIAHSTAIKGMSFVDSITAVRAFFMISGFTISMVLVEKYSKYKNSYLVYIINRILKIYPPYWIILGLILIFSFLQFEYSKAISAHIYSFGPLDGIIPFLSQMNVFTKTWLTLTNIFIFGQDTILFLGLNLHTGALFFTPAYWKLYPQLHFFLLIPVAWVIALEIYFYIIAPFLVRLRTGYLLFFILMSLLLKVLLLRLGLIDDPWYYRFFPIELMYFILGILSYRLYKVAHMSKKNNLSYFLLLCVIAFTIFFPNRYVVYMDNLYLGLLFISIPYIFNLGRSWKFDRYIGEISYLIFLLQIFILTLMDDFHIPIIGSIGLTVTILTIVSSLLLDLTIINPVYRLRAKIPDFLGKRL